MFRVEYFTKSKVLINLNVFNLRDHHSIIFYMRHKMSKHIVLMVTNLSFSRNSSVCYCVMIDTRIMKFFAFHDKEKEGKNI